MHPLSRYLRIVGGEARPRYLVARSIMAKVPTSQERRWEEHDRAMERARTVLDVSGPLASPSLMDLKAALARPHMSSCSLCPWRCGAVRRSGRGRCGVSRPRVASAFTHLGEEAPLVPSYTVFFAGCNLDCAFCQNYDLSTMPDRGAELSAEELARSLDAIVRSGRGIRNINWVGGDPVPALPYVLDVLRLMEEGVAQVWNSNMYLEEDSMRLLDGVIDLYLTDLKFGNDECARRLCGAPDYSSVVRRNHLLAADQGELLVRHLQLPGHLECCTLPIIDWLADNLPQAAVNLMDQYRPEHRAREHPELRNLLRKEERQRALEHARGRGLFLL
ncbi:hypothetical protein AOA80_11050 [Methanomassiliicoccales archaeon RumEn M1]|jgi:putative pyruvate formate lyase activating enzyme|nr:hypothetical protein AOA80_11050 [Methanomassiliicoccales archaeon RumEn M1]